CEAIVVTPEEGGLLVHGVISDRSDRRRADQEALALGREQARHLDGLGRFAGAVAHDFNNLITGVLGNVNLARIAGNSSRACLARMGAVALRAADQCGQLGLFAGKGVAKSGAVDLGELLRRLAEGTALPPGQRVSLDVTERLPPAAGDEP